MILWPTLFAPVVLGDLILVGAHAHADVVLPGIAGFAGDPGLARVLILFRRAADASNDFLGFLGLLLLVLCLSRLFCLASFRGRGLLELVKGLCMLAFGRADRAPRFGFACCKVSLSCERCCGRSWCRATLPRDAISARLGVARGVVRWVVLELTRHGDSAFAALFAVAERQREMIFYCCCYAPDSLVKQAWGVLRSR